MRIVCKYLGHFSRDIEFLQSIALFMLLSHKGSSIKDVSSEGEGWYSHLPNKRGVTNKRGGWQNSECWRVKTHLRSPA